MKNKWEITRYLIDAKKNVDSMWFIAENSSQLSNIGLRKKVNDIERDFYINCCVVIDEYIKYTKKEKKDLCTSDEIIRRIFYERDKNSAHKDETYSKRNHSSLLKKMECMKSELIHVREVCKECIPDNVTLDFVPHDKELFRFIYHVTADVEEKINEKKYPLRNLVDEKGETHSFSVFNDTEDFRYLSEKEKSKYGVVIQNGICFNEGIQERQDAAIKINLLCDENMWVEINKKEMEKVQELTKLGAFDIFGIIQEPPKDPILMAKIMKILESPKEN